MSIKRLERERESCDFILERDHMSSFYSDHHLEGKVSFIAVNNTTEQWKKSQVEVGRSLRPSK